MPAAEYRIEVPVPQPYDTAAVVSWLARHAVPGVDAVEPERATVTTTAIDATEVTVTFAGAIAHVRIAGDPAKLADVRRWLDLDTDPAVVAAALAADPALARLVAARPGVRMIQAIDPFRALLVAVLGQQVSVGAARTLTGRFVTSFGGGRFPAPEQVAAADPAALARAVGIPAARGRTLVAAAEAVATGAVRLHGDADREAVAVVLGALRGIGPWTIADVRMRALGDRDVWPAGDLVLRRAVAAGGLVAGFRHESVAPWRSYAAHHVWVGIAHDRHLAASQREVSR